MKEKLKSGNVGASFGEHMPSASGGAPTLLEAVGDLVEWWRSEQVQGVIIGGLAASLLGRPRVTQDVDALMLIDEAAWERFLNAGGGFGFVPRVPDALSFARQSRVLLMEHQPSGTPVDLVFAGLPFEEQVITSARAVDVGGVQIPLPTPEDLVVMKAFARRPRDLEDVRAIVDAHPNLDLERVRRWIAEFAEITDTPEMMLEMEAILAGRPSPD